MRAPIGRYRPGIGGVFLAAALTGLGACAASGQDRPASARLLAEAVAGAWQAGDAAAVSELLDSQGVALELAGSSNPAVRPPQARAALARVFGEHPSGPVMVIEVQRLGGNPERGLARLSWRPGDPGESPELPLFLALQRSAQGWMVTEVRLVRTPELKPDGIGRHSCP